MRTKQFKTILLLAVVASLLSNTAFAQQPLARPESVSVSGTRLAQMNGVIADAIKQRRLPGAVVLVGRKGSAVWRKAYGSRAVEPTNEAMSLDTVFDLASLTKVVATATSIMILI